MRHERFAGGHLGRLAYSPQGGQHGADVCSLGEALLHSEFKTLTSPAHALPLPCTPAAG